VSRNGGIDDLHIMLTRRCDMKCRYCFVDNDMCEESDPNKIRSSMGSLLKKRLLSSNSFVTFTGGEPTLELPSMIRLSRMLSQSGCRPQLHLQTNGLCKKRVKQALGTVPFTHVTISIDGSQRVHDECRIDMKGQGTYERVVETARLCIRYRSEGKLRSPVAQATVTKSSLPLKECIGCIVDLGFDRITIGVVFGAKQEIDYGVSPELFAGEYAGLHKDVMESLLTESPFIDDMSIEILKDIMAPSRIKAKCGAGSTLIAVSPSGDFYPCSTLAGLGIGGAEDYEQIRTIGFFDRAGVQPGDGFCLLRTCEDRMSHLEGGDLFGQIRSQTSGFLERLTDAELRIVEENLLRLVVDG